MTTPAEDCWAAFVELGHWAWDTGRCYLPRALWKRLSPSLPTAALGDWNAETKAAVSAAPWRQLWFGAPRQRLFRKVFGIVAVAPMSMNTLMHVAFDVGQIGASGGVEKLERLAAGIRDPADAAAVRAVADVFRRLDFRALRTFAPDTAVAGVTAGEVTALKMNIENAKTAVCRMDYPKHTSHGRYYGLVVVLIILVVWVIAGLTRRMLAASQCSATGVRNATLALAGVAGVVWVGSCLAHKHVGL
ncbi:MAG: hypothetical protein KGL39_01350 [Patescibacteria group bacterium]|nr:hypothetical protein [Patescibacteria group bacterium]